MSNQTRKEVRGRGLGDDTSPNERQSYFSTLPDEPEVKRELESSAAHACSMPVNSGNGDFAAGKNG